MASPPQPTAASIIWTDFNVPSSIEGSYELIVRPFKKTYNRGERLWVEAYVSGYGELAGGKLVFIFPPMLLQPQSLPVDFENTPAEGYQEGGIVLAINQQTGVETAIPSGQNFPGVPGDYRSRLNLGGTIFGFHRGLGLAARGVGPGGQVPMVAGETNLKLRPPLLISGRVSESAPPGDHDIPFVLTYLTKGKAKSARVTLELHVRHWWERRPTQFIILAASIATVVGIVLSLFHI